MSRRGVRNACTIVRVNWVIVIAGVVGLGVAGYGLFALAVNAWRRKVYGGLVVAVLVVVGTVTLLLSFGDRLLQ